MELIEIFNTFCRYVDKEIFSEENIGSYVAFVIDQAFIKQFCHTYSISEYELMSSVKACIFQRDILSIKGILAIQLYAASKRAYSDGITARDYRDRLAQVLNWDIKEVQKWFQDYQEQSWELLYQWCDSHFYYITKCERKKNTGKYVQYPVKQALCVFTDEDLKYIAAAFVDKNLQPGEDIQEKDFWRLLNNNITSYIGTNHGKDVITKSISEKDYKTQIFNFYLRWDGKFKIKNNQHIQAIDTDICKYYLYIRKGYKQIEVRTNNLTLIHAISLADLSSIALKKYYNFKRDGVIVFKKDDIYEDTWQETRYIDSGNEGIAVCLKGTWYCSLLRRHDNILFENQKVIIYRVIESLSTKDFFTQKRDYSLEGGLKIGRNIYLRNAGPVLRLERLSHVWIDSKLIKEKKLIYSFYNLSPGMHTIKLPHFKKIDIEIVIPKLKCHFWNNDYNKWYYNKKNVIWESGKYEHGNVGLDFSSIVPTDVNSSEGILERWAKYLLVGRYNNNETNIGIKIIR